MAGMAHRTGRILTHNNVVPQLRALLSPAAIFPVCEEVASSDDDGEKNDELTVAPQLPAPITPIGLETTGELLCLDVGMRRTGVAVTAFKLGDVRPLSVLHHPPKRAGGDARMQALQDDIDFLERTVEDYNVRGLIVGWPLEPHTGKRGTQCERVHSYVVRLQQAALLKSLSSGILLDTNYGQRDCSGSGDDDSEDLSTPSGRTQIKPKIKPSLLACLDVYTWDERYSSQMVQSLSRDNAVSPFRRGRRKWKRSRNKRKRRLADVKEQAMLPYVKNHDDDLAAAYILSEVVDALFADESEQWQKNIMGF